MSRMTEEPGVGHSVHVYDTASDKGMNGIIIDIDWENDRLVTVSFYEHGEDTFDWDEFAGQLNERVNQWQIVR